MNLERNLNEQITLPTQEPGFDVMGTAENNDNCLEKVKPSISTDMKMSEV